MFNNVGLTLKLGKDWFYAGFFVTLGLDCLEEHFYKAILVVPIFIHNWLILMSKWLILTIIWLILMSKWLILTIMWLILMSKWLILTIMWLILISKREVLTIMWLILTIMWVILAHKRIILRFHITNHFSP